MAFEETAPSFDGPIPGQSLTSELGGRPWQSKSQYTTVDEAVEYYMSRMTSDDFMDQLIDIMEMGVPITNIANSMQLASVMEGVHTVDVGMLVMPVIMEMMMLLGDSAGIEYETGLDNPNKNKVRPTRVRNIIKDFEKKLKTVDINMGTDEKEVEETEVVKESGGLMARRN
tara:strand:+ start:1476 stop:1988 length:513 start_codon:yes stop_codon:yes gene_type:complete